MWNFQLLFCILIWLVPGLRFSIIAFAFGSPFDVLVPGRNFFPARVFLSSWGRSRACVPMLSSPNGSCIYLLDKLLTTTSKLSTWSMLGVQMHVRDDQVCGRENVNHKSLTNLVCRDVFSFFIVARCVPILEQFEHALYIARKHARRASHSFVLEYMQTCVCAQVYLLPWQKPSPPLAQQKFLRTDKY